MAHAQVLGASSRSAVVKNAKSMHMSASVIRPLRRTLVAPVVAFRNDKQAGQSTREKAAPTGKKQPLVPPLGRPPSNPRENAESVMWFVAIAGFFLTGVLFVTIPAFQVGGHAFTKTWQQGVNKSVGIEEPQVAGKTYAPGPGPAAAPDSPAAKM